MFKHKLKATLLAAASLGLLASPLAAQQIDEVVVTAEKRSASLQETPIAITAISAETLELQKVENVNDLNAFAPNLVARPGTTNKNASVLTIRGIGISGEEMLTQDAPTGIYIDGLAITKGAAMSVDLADIEQVEVLRGPQGTLFGRNAIGGAVSFKTRRPSNEAGLTMQIGGGNYGYKNAKVKADLGDLGNNGMRVSLGYSKSERDGVINNLLVGNDKDPGADETSKFRVAIDWDISDTVNAYYTFDRTASDSYQNYYQTMVFDTTPLAPGFPSYADIYGPLLRGTAFANPGAGCPTALSANRLDNVCINDLGKSENDTQGHMLQLEFALNGMTLRSVTGQREWDFNSGVGDLNGFGALAGVNRGYSIPAYGINVTIPASVASTIYSADSRRHHEQLSQEFTLISDSSGKLRWVAGVFFLDEEGEESGMQYVYLALGNPPLIAANTLIPAASPSFKMESESRAIYGQIDYDMSDRLTLSTGIRYSEDEMDVVQTVPAAAAGTRSEKFSEPTGHITAAYEVNDNINTYAKIARGYRSGGFAARGDGDKFDEETATSYELGLKTQYDRVRFNAAIFSTDYKDRQITQPVVSAGAYVNKIVNASEQTIEGVELEVDVAMTDLLSLSASYGYLDIETKGFLWNIGTAANPNIQDISGNLVNTEPQDTGNFAITYENDTSIGKVTARVNANYTASYHSFANTYVTKLVKDVVSQSRTLIDAQIRIDNAFGSSAFIDIWGKNLTDKEYVTRAIDFQSLGHAGVYWGDPRTVGINVGVKF